MDRKVMVTTGLCMLALAQTALASTGMAGLDSTFQTFDGGIGSTGYMLLIVGLLGIIGTLATAHYYATFGIAVFVVVAGAFLGHRQQLAGTMNLALGAALDWQPWPLELLP